MKIRALLLTALTLVLGLPGLVRADGFIIIKWPPTPIPAPFPYAPMEVTYHHVNVKIDGQICTTSVDEEFYNPNAQRLEGTYIFPIPATAQIDKFTMQINGQETEAELLPADKSRAIYEDIVRRERDPALLEYADRGVFRVHVYPNTQSAKYIAGRAFFQNGINRSIITSRSKMPAQVCASSSAPTTISHCSRNIPGSRWAKT